MFNEFSFKEKDKQNHIHTGFGSYSVKVANWWHSALKIGCKLLHIRPWNLKCGIGPNRSTSLIHITCLASKDIFEFASRNLIPKIRGMGGGEKKHPKNLLNFEVIIGAQSLLFKSISQFWNQKIKPTKLDE